MKYNKLQARLLCYLAKHVRPRLCSDSFAICIDNGVHITYNKNSYKPVVIHFPGGQKNLYFREKAINELLAVDKINCPKDIQILQINNLPIAINKNPAECFLEKTGVAYMSAGKNILHNEWKNSTKIRLLYESLKNIQDKAKYFLFFDSSDAILVNNPEILIDALSFYNCKVLFGMDLLMHNGKTPLKNLIKPPKYIYEYQKDHFRFLNSGMIFGEVMAMQTILKDFISTTNITCKSDQHYYHQLRFKYDKEIAIDYQKKYLLNIYPFKNIFFTGLTKSSISSL